MPNSGDQCCLWHRKTVLLIKVGTERTVNVRKRYINEEEFFTRHLHLDDEDEGLDDLELSDCTRLKTYFLGEIVVNFLLSVSKQSTKSVLC